MFQPSGHLLSLLLLPSCPELDAILLQEQSRKTKVPVVLQREEKQSRKLGRGGLGASEQDIISLVAGTDRERDTNYASPSSDEDVIESDLSMNESDYPLRNESLLQKLLYSDQPPAGHANGKPYDVLEKAQVEEPPPLEDDSTKAGSDGTVPVSTANGTPTQSITSTAVIPTSKPPHEPPTTSATHTSSRAASTTTTNTTDDWSSISSLFGSQDRTLESAIVQAVGIEKLTRLGRVTSARVMIESLQLDPSALDRIHSLQRKTKGRIVGSQIPWSAETTSGRY